MPYDRTVGAYIERKQAIATDLTTREMQELSCQIRERAFWSATVNNAKVVNTMQRACADFAKGNLSMSDARLAIQKALDSVGYKPADGTKGSIRDLNTFRRQDLILRTNLEMAQGYARSAEAQEDLDIYPCYELIRVKQARQPRDWKSRWKAAGGKLYGGKMIAEVNDPIWSKISRFGNPYPPFDFNSGMGLRDVSRGEAVRCGAISEDSFAEPKDIPSINESLESEIRGASESLKADISEKLKGLAKWEGDKLVFTDPNGTKPYSSKDIVDVLNKPLPENFYGDGKSPYHQRDALIEWTKDSDYIKNHTTSDKAYHFGRLLKRIEPMKSDEKLYRGMSWNTKYPNQKELYDGFMDQVESGYFERSTFESYSTNAAMVKENYMKKPTKVFITVVKHSNAKYIGEVVKRYFERNTIEQEVLFSRGGRMKILKKEVRGDTIYLTVEESQ